MKTKHFKSRHALLMSLTSLMLCVSMLFGATFAWFTDSVTSGVNRIVSGNLDVELQYKDGNDWKDATDATAIFSDVTTGAILNNSLWEPGHTEVAYLRLRNAGTLALKYHLDIYVANEKAATNVAGQSFKLSDYIYYGITDAADEQTTYTSADRAVAAAKATSLISDNNVAANGDLLANTAPEAGWQYINLVAFMPEDVDNAANYRGTAPEIGLGVLLQATQMENESDSFGTDYDRTVDDFAARPEAEFTASATTAVTKDADNKLTGTTAVITTTNAVANVPVGAVLDESANELTLTVEKMNEVHAIESASNFTMASNNQVGQYFEIKVDGLASNNDQLVSVALNVGEGLTDLVVYHNGTELPANSADAASNDEYYTYSGSTLTLYVKSFSPFSVLYHDSSIKVSTTEEAQAALDNARPGDVITLTAGNYGKLYLRPNETNPAVTTKVNNFSSYYQTYSLFKDLTIKGTSGAIVDTIVSESGQYTPDNMGSYSQNNGEHNYVLNLIEFSNVTIEGITFTNEIMLGAHSNYGVKVDGLTIRNCAMNASEGTGHFLYKVGSTTAEHTYTYQDQQYTFIPSLKNITVTGCTIKGSKMGIELREAENVTITNNTFEVEEQNILLATNNSCQYTGSITITGNTSEGSEERFVRAKGVNGTLTIKNNTVSNYIGHIENGSLETDVIKVTDASGTYDISNNSVVSNIAGTTLVSTYNGETVETHVTPASQE